jgi:hypothetical protein
VLSLPSIIAARSEEKLYTLFCNGAAPPLATPIEAAAMTATTSTTTTTLL